MKNMIVLAESSVVDGVGRTTLAGNLAAAFESAGWRPLLVDLDPQATMTMAFLGKERARRLSDEVIVVSILRSDRPDPGRLIRPSWVEGVDFVAGSAEAGDLDGSAYWMPGRGPRGTVRDFLRDLSGYDIAILDIPRGCSLEATIAADLTIFPYRPGDLEISGIDLVPSFLDKARELGCSCRMGFVSSMRGRTKFQAACEASIRAQIGESAFFSTMIPHDAAFRWPSYRRRAAGRLKPLSGVAKIIGSLTREVMARIEVGDRASRPAVAGVPVGDGPVSPQAGPPRRPPAPRWTTVPFCSNTATGRPASPRPYY